MPESAGGHVGTLIFGEPLLLLASAVAFVALFKRLGLGSVLGYLAAGVLVGPVLGVITDAQQIFQVSELGVVLFLFIIGLELRPARLMAMRSDIFGLGLAQVLVTGAALTAALWATAWRFEPAFIIGFGLAMSSTAFGMQILEEANETNTPYGQKSVAILLFQDIAIVPLLAVVPMLSPTNTATAFSFSEILVGVTAAAGSFAALYLAGRFLLNPIFRLLAHVRARETMTAAALLVVLGAAALMHFGGMSMAMGAFVAGLILADSSFRHELEANIEPFRGILLGLFFMAVGMSINIDALAHSWGRILFAVIAVMVLKAVILYGLARLFRASHNTAVRIAGLLPQAGEFAFVLFAAAASVRALWPSDTSFVAAVVTVTMALTPLSVRLAGRLVRAAPPEVLDEDFDGAGGDVLVIGFGRFGQIVSQVLLARGIAVTIIDSSAERIRQAARFGFRIYFGDGTRRDVLRAAGADKTAIICICVDQPATTSAIAEMVLSEFETAKVYARSWDRNHAIDLLEEGIDFEIRETFESAMAFGAETLRGLGYDAEEVDATVADVRKRDADRLALQRRAGGTAGAPRGPVQPEPLVPLRSGE
ncbi:monovalent cation:proton antiporter-2 (CPA2) family protein, partial [Propylenella binzhouense]